MLIYTRELQHEQITAFLSYCLSATIVHKMHDYAGPLCYRDITYNHTPLQTIPFVCLISRYAAILITHLSHRDVACDNIIVHSLSFLLSTAHSKSVGLLSEAVHINAMK